MRKKVKMGRFRSLLFALATLFLLAPTSLAAGEVDVKKIVFEHLGDSYEWHITSWGSTPIAVPLPVIVRGESGWRCFLSSKLHGDATYEGFYIAREGEYSGKVVQKDATGVEVRPLDLSFTKNALSLMINSLILVLIILYTARWYRSSPQKVPKGFRGLIEMLVVSINDDLIKPCVGKGYEKYSPYLLTAFFFILVNNLMGIIPIFPGGANVTGNIAVTLVLALCTFFVVNFSGTKSYWKEIFWPDVPLWLKFPAPIMPVIELFGVFTKPFALMIRLFANIMAGHSIILGLTCLVFITASMGAGVNASMSFVSVVFTIFMNLVELLVAFIQAYVFTMLSAVFIGLARAEHGEKVDKF